MDNKLKEYLKKYEIEYKVHEHHAVFTVAESDKLVKLPFIRGKNLFMKDEKNNYYLVCLPTHKMLNMKSLKIRLEVSKLSFASPEELKKELNLTPGSVSIFGMIHAKSTILILDKELWDSDIVGFHPNINTATLELSHENLKKFWDSLKCKKEIISLE